jgi:hypothetical protein
MARSGTASLFLYFLFLFLRLHVNLNYVDGVQFAGQNPGVKREAGTRLATDQYIFFLFI